MEAKEQGIVLDVREILQRNEEPFKLVMATVETLPEGRDLHLHATFEPQPLIKVLARQGFSHTSIQHAEDHWEVVFHRGSQE